MVYASDVSLHNMICLRLTNFVFVEILRLLFLKEVIVRKSSGLGTGVTHDSDSHNKIHLCQLVKILKGSSPFF